MAAHQLPRWRALFSTGHDDMPPFFVCIDSHTTSSTPRPYVLYLLRVQSQPPIGLLTSEYVVLRRYSEFCTLKVLLNDSYALPPKHDFTHTVIPSSWIQNEVISERKTGLSTYLSTLLRDTDFSNHPVLIRFLSPGPFLDVEGVEIVEAAQSRVARSQSPSIKLFPDPIAAAYYPSWARYTLPPSNIEFSKFDIIFFAFVTPTASADIQWDPGSQDTLRELVLCAHQSSYNTKIVLSIGGWGGCYWFTQAMGSSVNRARLTNALIGAMNLYGLDGIDIDWEYPNSPGAGNPYSPNDANNFLSFVKLLRAALGPLRIISAAVAHLPWLGSNGRPLTDVSQYAAALSYVNIMNYDVFVASTNPGPNAPLGNLCGTSQQLPATAQAAVVQWTNAGMPASKLLLGLPLYGYVSRSSATALSGSSTTGVALLPLPHPKQTNKEGIQFDHGNQGDLSGMWGQQIAFKQLLSSGALRKMSDGNYTGTNGFTMGWDDCSDTPFLFSVPKTTVVTYDDTWSLGSKARFAKQSGMAGCFTWSLDQDDGFALQRVIRASLGRD